MQESEFRALRLGALAVSVLYDVDLQPASDGVVLTGRVPVKVSWADFRAALAGHDPESEAGRKRLVRWLIARRQIADLSGPELAERIRPVGLPRGHDLHPGHDWVRESVLGHTLDVGLGAVSAEPGPDRTVVVIPPEVWTVAGIDPTPWWPQARAYLRAMSLLAVQRMKLAPDEPLRPMGDCDVVTLLASQKYREALAQRADGLAAVAVPMRNRGWTDLRAIDPAFAVAAAQVTAPAERGFSGPILVTSDEVVLPGQGPLPSYR